jgi:L-rhamnose isomerase
MNAKTIEKNYKSAKERYSEEMGINTEKALQIMQAVPLSIHCWQGDDVGGFERPDSVLDGGGLQVTGNYPGKARNPSELRLDMEKAFSLIPGRHRANVHAIYGEFGGKLVDRDEIEPKHFKGWTDWAKSMKIGLDFNASCFSHANATDGYTISSLDSGIRKFWMEHVQRCREISAFMGKEVGSACIHNLWIPDGCKDESVQRWAYRSRLKQSLDEIFKKKHDPKKMKDSIEGKLFGIGSEAFVVGSNDFYLGYAVKNGVMPCMDLGHYHPTESVADKVSAVLQFCQEVLIHASRGVRWDSDHVAILSDELKSLLDEIVRIPALDRVHVSLDYFDGSMNRIGAWAIGGRAVRRAILLALLEPTEKIRRFDEEGNSFGKLALLEESKAMPFGAVWEYCCLKSGVPSDGTQLIKEVMNYEARVQSKRK